MNVQIRPYSSDDLEDIVRLSLKAWEPVFASFKQILGPEIFPVVYPDWEASQREEIEKTCKDTGKTTTLVADVDGTVAGFAACILNNSTRVGEIYFLAVHPEFQNRGIGTALNNHGLQLMKESGMIVAKVGTGGDPSHAPARKAYEKAGFKRAIPAVHYYKLL